MKRTKLLQIIAFCLCTYLVFSGLEWLLDQKVYYLTLLAIVNLAAWVVVGIYTQGFTHNPFRKRPAQSIPPVRSKLRAPWPTEQFQQAKDRIRPRSVIDPPQPPPNRKIGRHPETTKDHGI